MGLDQAISISFKRKTNDKFTQSIGSYTKINWSKNYPIHELIWSWAKPEMIIVKPEIFEKYPELLKDKILNNFNYKLSKQKLLTVVCTF